MERLRGQSFRYDAAAELVFNFADPSRHAVKNKTRGKQEHSQQYHADRQDRGWHMQNNAGSDIVNNCGHAGGATAHHKSNGKYAEESQGFIITQECEDRSEDAQAVVQRPDFGEAALGPCAEIDRNFRHAEARLEGLDGKFRFHLESAADQGDGFDEFAAKGPVSGKDIGEADVEHGV